MKDFFKDLLKFLAVTAVMLILSILSFVFLFWLMNNGGFLF